MLEIEREKRDIARHVSGESGQSLDSKLEQSKREKWTRFKEKVKQTLQIKSEATDATDGGRQMRKDEGRGGRGGQEPRYTHPLNLYILHFKFYIEKFNFAD